MSNATNSKRTTSKRTSTRSKEIGIGGTDVTTSEAAPMIYIYTRVSTTKQTGDNQSFALLELYKGAELVEEVAGGTKARPKLDALIAGLKKGDTIVVYSLDRLGRSTRDVLGIIEAVIAAGARLVLHREQVNYDTAVGRMLIQVMASVAELERNLISERTKTALAQRKAQGVKLGRPRLLPNHKRDKARAMASQGKSIRVISKLLDVSKSTVQEWLVASN